MPPKSETARARLARLKAAKDDDSFPTTQGSVSYTKRRAAPTSRAQASANDATHIRVRQQAESLPEGFTRGIPPKKGK